MTKGEIIRQYAKEHNIPVVDIKIAQVDQTDYLGVPVRLVGNETGVSYQLETRYTPRYSLTLGGPKLGYTSVIIPIWSNSEFPRMGL